MKQVIQCASRPALFGWVTRLFGSFVCRDDARRRGRTDLLSDYMLRDIGLHNMRDDALYGDVRRRW
jgi:hypothetical protein